MQWLTRQSAARTLILIWALWAVVVIGFQTLVDARMNVKRPDYALAWTPDETQLHSQDDRPYLIEPFMNRQVSWDSEYYLSIAVAGYDDTDVPSKDGISLNYAFFPLYPMLMRGLSVPLGALGMNAKATATLAGVLISLVGALAGMFALYDLTKEQLGDDGGLRAAFYLLIFPSGFFLAQVFTEGLFIGLAFGCLALLRRRQLVYAGVLAMLAVWTRGVGLALLPPLVIVWLQTVDWAQVRGNRRYWLSLALRAVAVLLPIIAYLVWRAALGVQFDYVEDHHFGRALFNFDRVIEGWKVMFEAITTGKLVQSRAYYLLEVSAFVVTAVACVATARRFPLLVLFSVVAVILPTFTSAPQSLIRYMLAVPCVFAWLAGLGRSAVFDRSWTTLSVLLMGLLTLLFTFDMWVA